MKAQKTYLTRAQAIRLFGDAYVNWRIAADAILWGLCGLPPKDSLPDLMENIRQGKNVFSSIPRMRGHYVPFLVFNTDGPFNVIIMGANGEHYPSPGKIGILNDGLYSIFGSTYDAVEFKVNYKNFPNDMPFENLAELVNQYLPEQCVVAVFWNNKPDVWQKNGVEWFKTENNVYSYTDSRNKNYYSLNANYLIRNFSMANPDLLEAFPAGKTLIKYFLCADNLRVQLPELPASILDDPHQGLWDAWWPQGSNPDSGLYLPFMLEKEVEAADPWDSVQEGAAVCIDFGTSGTVAAVREDDETVRLLRIGGSFGAEPGPADYENPTALGFADYESFMQTWQNEPWRPLVEWRDVKVAHLAKDELKHGSLPPQCGIRNIKTWARNLPGQEPLLLGDGQGRAFSVAPLPVQADQGIGDFGTRPLDPIELYAFFLGVMLNNQVAFGGRIYRDYNLTFPIRFDNETKARILQGFRRGLLRSLPLSLASSVRFRENSPFRVSEVASEPVAFAASALPAL